MTKNEHRVGIQVKDAILNFSEVIPKHLVYIHNYFLNGFPNRKRLYSKVHILHNQNIEKIIIAVKDIMINQKFHFKNQSLQHHEIACAGWLYRYTDKVDCSLLEEYLIAGVMKLLKCPAQLVCSTKGIFAGQALINDEKSSTI